MRKVILVQWMLLLAMNSMAWSQEPADFPVRGFCIGAPSSDQVPEFIRMIHEILAPGRVNTLVLRIDYNYAFTSHPELRVESPLSYAQVKSVVAACKEEGIRIIPQINLLGHQSWHSTPGRLLAVYPEFDETPQVAFPEIYVWPNDDQLYCKSYCPLHPEIHAIIFDLIDELVEVFEADAFHAGMDEVFYLAEEQCPRCNGLDPAELFAGEVRAIHEHLAQTNKELWIWGDRLIDGKLTGIGMWEASMNNTARAIDMIPRDVVICDWHYEQAIPTAAYFASKGFQVITCPWREPRVAETEAQMTQMFRTSSPEPMAGKYLGMMQTVWSGASGFYQESKKEIPETDENGRSVVMTFRALSKLW